jgi:hypothetical protein
VNAHRSPPVSRIDPAACGICANRMESRRSLAEYSRTRRFAPMFTPAPCLRVPGWSLKLPPASRRSPCVVPAMTGSKSHCERPRAERPCPGLSWNSAGRAPIPTGEAKHDRAGFAAIGKAPAGSLRNRLPGRCDSGRFTAEGRRAVDAGRKLHATSPESARIATGLAAGFRHHGSDEAALSRRL